ncbi:hypothetical protein ACIF8T_37615 [Streptomyces sp. NPDC085946]|uniref:hypothetical protein n=1 Tax=Streptomyces sp. NPDC085946 TaxID=3365744 RepID=UPI0037CDBFBD
MKTPTRPETAPFITAWSGEQPQQRTVVYAGRGGIAFADERPEDRDQYGVLWNGRAMAPGTGHPLYGDVHPLRQRHAMQHLLCQVCGGPADRDERGALWLLEDNRSDWTGCPNDLLTTHPPLCLPCASTAVTQCPHLTGNAVAVRVRDSDVCAVYGRIWSTSACGRPVRTAVKDVVPYSTMATRWVLAGQLVRALNHCTLLDLQHELKRSS